MLCYPFEAKRLLKWNMPLVHTQPKLDGERCRAILYDNTVTLLSSEENTIISVPHINEALLQTGLNNIELDGELYIHGMSFEGIHSIVSRKENIHPSFESMEYHIFDIAHGANQFMRLRLLKELESSLKPPLRVVPTSTVDAREEKIVEQMLFYNKQGYEGIIVRNPAGLYVRRRSTEIMKFKPRKTDSYKIIGFEEEISIDGIPKNALGALILQSDQNQVFKVGSGNFLTRDRREELWQNRTTLIGQTAEIAYQALTDRKVPRFPVLMNVLSIQKEEASVSGVENL
jgi:ATP-dependent DNA ligase